MKTATAVEKLAADFRRWGRVATKRVQKMTEKYGAVFGAWQSADDEPRKG